MILATESTVSSPSYGYLLGDNSALADPAKFTAIYDLLNGAISSRIRV